MSRLADQARTYIGTPFKHRGRTVRGLDCAGLIVKAYADLGVEIGDLPNYGRTPFRDGLMQHVRSQADEVPVSDMQDGDIAVMVFAKDPHHLAIIANDVFGGLSLIHADGSVHVSRVVETRLTDDKRKQIFAVFRRPF